MKRSISTKPGTPNPLGFSLQGTVANFSLFSANASSVVLGLFDQENTAEIPMNRTGDIWHIGIEPWAESMEYAFHVDGPQDRSKGHLFDPQSWLADPVAKFPSTPNQWGIKRDGKRSRCIPNKPFDWQGTSKPNIPLTDLIIYEMHVRGFTQHPSSGVSHPGTFLGLIEKIPYLKKLGVNAIELMPIFEFDETHCDNIDPASGKHLVNYWGYNPLYLFAPMRRYASDNAVLEFQTLVRELHRNGMEVILDVVYNHTGEGEKIDYRYHFRGIDNASYYMVDEQGNYRNFTGCGNTFNSNHPAVMKLILESLRYWVQEMQVDGFRFDLAAIHTRGVDGKVMKHPPLLEAIAKDPVLKTVKHIAEAWDAAGLYMVSSFPHFGSWSVWNGKFRDIVRNFIKGTPGTSGRFADVLCGSEFLYDGYSPLSSINFVTAHDGFTLYDLVSYNSKHNLANGERGQDGNNQNCSWNCGAEGPTNHQEINALRERQLRNFLLALFLAQGIPMLLMGDEYGHTRNGNNNPYVQDNEINWFLWDLQQKKQEMVDFVSNLIGFRKAHPCLRMDRFLNDTDIDWHGIQAHHPNWNHENQLIAYSFKGKDPLYIAFNAGNNPANISLPKGPWIEIVRTDRPWNAHNFQKLKKEPILSNVLELPSYSAAILTKVSGP